MPDDELLSPTRRSLRLAERPPATEDPPSGRVRKRPLPPTEVTETHQWESKRPWAPPPKPYYERPPPRVMLRRLSPEDQDLYHHYYDKYGAILRTGKYFDRGPKVPESRWVKYYNELSESDGFDFTPFPVVVRSMRITVANWDYIAKTPEGHKKLKGYATEALTKYNQTYKTNWEVDDIDYVNGGFCGYLHYYITFTAKTATRKQTFQAKVQVTPGRRSITYPICRKKKATAASSSTSRP